MTRNPASLVRDARRISHRGPAAPAFTLVEVLIVVVILGILAAIVVPQFTSAAAESRDNAIKMDLYRIRQQIEIYKEQHNGDYPTFIDFTDQMTQPTDAAGVIQPVGTPGAFGPYIERMPDNPNTSSNIVGNGAVGTSDWFYNEATGAFNANDSIETRTY